MRERKKERRKVDHVLRLFQIQDDRLVSPRDAELRHWAGGRQKWADNEG